MALIQNASNRLTKGINEAYGLATTAAKGGLGAAAEKYKRDLEKGKKTPGGIYDDKKSSNKPTVLGYSTENTAATGAGKTNLPYYGPPKELAPSLTSTADDEARAESNQKAEARRIIGAGWDDSGDIVKDAGKSLDSSKKFISNLGKVRDQYLTANDEYKKKTDEAIAGNKTLIEKNQQQELDDLGENLRKNVNNTQIMLGVKGASGGSAGRAAAAAMARAAGKDRASILTTRGNEMSEQDQAAQDAQEQYTLRRDQAYKWEEEARKMALEEYLADRDSLDRLKKNSSKWKEQDVKAESDRKLSQLLATLSDISARAKTFRENLAAKMAEFGGNASELEQSAISVNAPSELQTPDFNESIDLSTDQNAEDFYDPNNTGKRVVKGYDAFGNPIYEDELSAATA